MRIAYRDAGYALEVDPERVDLLRFRSLVTQARESHDIGRRAKLLRLAFKLWRGDPLSGLTGEWVAQTQLALRQELFDMVQLWVQAEIHSGDPVPVLGPLADLVNENPLTESLTELLMLALIAAGRPRDALARYANIRQRLFEERGSAPKAGLQALYLQTVHDHLIAPRTIADVSERHAPQQLPATLGFFVGRASELAALTDLLGQEEDRRGVVVISAIGGTAGVGKTALAVQWAHQMCEWFPDGQLYVNLLGFDPSGAILEPATAIRGFLDALGVAPESIPADLNAQAALYRSELAGRRMLILLDNARDSNQVRPLLPGASGCLVLVTSRNQLSGLVATDGAHHITLDLLTQDEALLLLVRRVDSNRLAAEHSAVEDIIAHCARLPLALAIVAARAATHPNLPLQTFANELQDAAGRLDALTTDDARTNVRTVFSWSYNALTLNAARLFRLLGLHRGPDIAAPAAASLTALNLPRVRPLLAELARANLLIEHSPGRYTLHDLLRAYATDLVDTVDTDQRQAAICRLLDHYLHSAYTAARLLDPVADPLSLSTPQSGVSQERPTNRQEAMIWLSAELPVLLAAIDYASTGGFDRHAWQLSWTLWTYLDRRGRWHDSVTTGRVAIAAAHRLGDPTAQARAHRNLAVALTRLANFGDAHTQLTHALNLYRQVNDLAGQAHSHLNLAYLWERQGRHTWAANHGRALSHTQQALRLYRAADHQRGQARALNAVGWFHAQLGDYLQGLACCQQALALHKGLDNHIGEADTLDSLGYIQHHLGRHTNAIACYEQALMLWRDLSHRYEEATTLSNLGDAHHATGSHRAALDAWQHALTILDELRHPEADHVRTKLANVHGAD